GFLIDDFVVRLGGAEPMPPHAERAMALIVFDVIEALAVRRPGDAVCHVLDDLSGVLARRQVADGDGVKLRTLPIGEPGHEAVARIVLGTTEAEIAVPRFDVAVEEHRLGSALPRRAHQDRVLLSLFHPRIVGEGTVRSWNPALVLLDAAADFLEDFFLERGVRLAEALLEIAVLGFEVAADL